MHSSYEISLNLTNADVKRAWETAWFSKLGDDAMQTSLMDNTLKIADGNDDLIL